MKKSKLYLLCALLVVLLMACGPAPDAATPELEQPQGSENVTPRPTVTSVPQEGGSEPVSEPAATAVPDGYPSAPPQQVQPEAAYPGGDAPVVQQPQTAYPADGSSVWIILPVGLQCEENSGKYADLDAAVTDLDTAGVVVTDQGTIELMVTAVCGAATSEHYHVQIVADGLTQAESLGWQLYGQ